MWLQWAVINTASASLINMIHFTNTILSVLIGFLYSSCLVVLPQNTKKFNNIIISASLYQLGGKKMFQMWILPLWWNWPSAKHFLGLTNYKVTSPVVMPPKKNAV